MSTVPGSEPRWEGKAKATPLGYRIFIGLLQKGGLKAAYRLLAPVTLYYRLFKKEAVRPLQYLYTRRLGMTPALAARTIRRNLIVFGQTLIDRMAVLSGGAKDLSFESEDGHYLNALAEAGSGGLIISAHLGAWEVAGHMLSRLGKPINVLMYDGEAAQMKAVTEKFDRKRSFNIIYIREDGSHIYDLSAALQRGELICIHADRFRPGTRTMDAEFLGATATFPAGPFILASKLRAPVCFVFAFKETDLHYHFQAFPPKTYEGRGTSGAEIMLRDYIALLEDGIRRHPEQWFNYFSFWKEETHD